MSIQVLAHHAHVFPQEVNPGGTIDRLLKLLDVCGVAEAVCFAPFAAQVKGLGIAPNKWLAKELQKRDRLYGFATIDFERDDLKDQVREAYDLGFRGLKLHPNTQQFDILGAKAMAVYSAADERKMFLTFHSGVHHYRLEHYRVTKFDEVVQQFPGLRISLEHVGGYHFFNEALAVIFNNIPFPPLPNQKGRVYGGLTSVFTPHYCRFWYMPKERMQELILQVGPEQLIFGLDFPYNLEDNTRLALETINEMIPSEDDRALVLGDNLRRELGLEVKSHL